MARTVVVARRGAVALAAVLLPVALLGGGRFGFAVD